MIGMSGKEVLRRAISDGDIKLGAAQSAMRSSIFRAMELVVYPIVVAANSESKVIRTAACRRSRSPGADYPAMVSKLSLDL